MRKWSSGGSTKFAKAPPLQLWTGEQSVRVHALLSLSVCVCARACVCVERGGSQPFLVSSTPGWAVGRRRRPPLAFPFPGEGGQLRPRAGRLEPGASSCQSQRAKGRPQSLGAGRPQSLGAERPAAPSARRGPADGRAWRSGARGPEGGPSGRQAPGTTTGWGRGDLDLGFYEVLRRPREA